MNETLKELRIKQKREELNLTQKQIADKIGIAESAYQRYEYGRLPNAKMAVKIARALKTTVEELYG